MAHRHASDISRLCRGQGPSQNTPLGDGIYVWDVGTEQLHTTLEGHASEVIALDFWPDDHTVISLSHDDTLLLWDLTPFLTETPWDVNNDGVVNILDLTLVASRFGENSPDLNGDGIVNILDLTLVAQHLGE
ncbi:MAG: dockerin type I domain-containing protein [Candidatus Poribacteria bacterium]|nr:dockerin type I domain-containing protein [Candidatus Poribacteria bacterium]